MVTAGRVVRCGGLLAPQGSRVIDRGSACGMINSRPSDAVAERALFIEPATPAFDAAGTPYSPDYGDVYHSTDSGPGQARHVFLGGNGLPARWARARVFTIVETGFGLGLNFLATWQAWRADATRPAQLHYVSIEKHPFTRENLALLHARYPEFSALARELQHAWPPLLPGFHRLEFESGAVALTLAFADVGRALQELRLDADACYLDGFAPTRNPEMWSEPVAKALARLARAGTTLATYTTARVVRHVLSEAGFACELKPGFGRKRHLLAASYAPRWRVRHARAAPQAVSDRSAIIIGAGLAGAAVAERLASRGWSIDLIERRAAPQMEASVMAAGVFHPLIARDDSVLARLTRAGHFLARGRWQALADSGLSPQWQRCGVLQLARDASEEARMQAAVTALRLPPSYAEYLPRAEAGSRVGRAVRAGGLWFASGGWMRPATLVAAQLEGARLRACHWRAHFGRAADRLVHDGVRWTALANDGSAIASATLCVLANSDGAARLADFGDAALKRVRGQISFLPAGSCGALTAVLAGNGYLVPVPEGVIAGATYDLDDDDPALRATSHAGNLARLSQLLPDPPLFDPTALAGSVGFRCVVRDRLPLIGAVPDLASTQARQAALSGAQLRDLPRLPGLYAAFAYASRGLTWASLGGEVIAALADAEPVPLEASLIDAIDPGRFALRLARRGRL